MKDEEIIKLLQLYRHDLMNQVQIIKGYLSMDKVDMVTAKLDDVVDNFNKERRLMNLSMPRYSLWVIAFNSVYKNIRLEYEIDDIEGSLEHIDDLLVTLSHKILTAIEYYSRDDILYSLTLDIIDTDKRIKLDYNLTGYIKEQASLVKDLNNVAQSYAKNEDVVCVKTQFMK